MQKLLYVASPYPNSIIIMNMVTNTYLTNTISITMKDFTKFELSNLDLAFYFIFLFLVFLPLIENVHKHDQYTAHVTALLISILYICEIYNSGGGGVAIFFAVIGRLSSVPEVYVSRWLCPSGPVKIVKVWP